MTKNNDCEVFQDRLDALSGGKLPDKAVEQLRDHARGCVECAMLLEMHEHLASPPLADLEDAVPDELVASVWPRVEAAIATRASARLRGSRGWHGWAWLVPALAAATLVLFVGSGLLFRELVRLRQREEVLVQRVAEQERWLAELELRTASDPVARTAGLAGRAAWERALARRTSVSVAELAAMLRSLPATATILGAAQAEEAAGSLPSWLATAWRGPLAELDSEDGIQARELLRLLERLDVDPERRVSTARLLALSRGAVRL